MDPIFPHVDDCVVDDEIDVPDDVVVVVVE